jgi:hypothetical protein
LKTILIDKIVREVGFDSHASIANTKERMNLNEIVDQEIM